MLHELVFLGCHSQFALYRTVIKVLEPATVRMHYEAVLSSGGALPQSEKIIANNKWSTVASAGFI